MRKAIFAVLAVLGMSLAASALAPVANARTHTYLFPPHQTRGGQQLTATPPAARCGRPVEGGSYDRDIPRGSGGADRRHPRLRMGEAERRPATSHTGYWQN